MIKLIFSARFPPHQAVLYSQIFLGHKADEIVKLSRRAPLRQLLSEFVRGFELDTVSKADLVRFCRPTVLRMDMSFERAVTAAETRKTYRHMAEDICGDTTFDCYNTGRMPAKITRWTDDVQTRIRKAKPATKVDCIAIALEAGHPPYYAFTYCLKEVLHESHRSVLERTGTPFRVLLNEIATRLTERHGDDAMRQLLQDCAAKLSHTLRESLSNPAYRSEFSAYEKLAERRMAELRFCDFETDELATDIHNWTDRVRRTVVRTLMGQSEERQLRILSREI
jgi:hypothetical protein